jgi:iron complex outermembrane receptor protein
MEAQIEAALGQLSFSAGLGWMKSDLGAFFAVDPRIPSFGACDPQTGPETASCHALEGTDQTYAPEFTFNLGVQYELELGNGSSLTPRLNYGHVSEQWATLFQNEARGDRIEARNIVNAQIAWRSGSYVTTLYGTNLTDQEYVGAINSGLRFAGPPRQFGLRLLKAF